MQLFQVQSSLHQQDLQWGEVSSTVQDDNLYTSYGNHAQGDVGNALLQWDEVSSTAQDYNLYTFSSLHGNNTQVENTLPQDLQDEAKTKLENIIKMHKKIEVCTIKCLPRTGSFCMGIKAMDKCINSSVARLIQHLASTDYRKQFRINKHLCRGPFALYAKNEGKGDCIGIDSIK